MSHEPHDEFDSFLAKHLRNSTPYIADDGFVEKTMQALPAPRSTRKIKIIAATTGLVLATPALISGGSTIFHWANSLTVASLLQIGLVTSGILFSSTVIWFGRKLDLI